MVLQKKHRFFALARWALLTVLSILIGGFLITFLFKTDNTVWVTLKEYFFANKISTILALNAGLLLFGIWSTRLSTRLNMPVLLLFLVAGMLLGSEHGFNFKNDAHNVQLVNFIGTMAMAFILYSGGLETDTRTLKRVMLPGTLLSTLGVLLTAIVLGAGVHFLMGWSWAWSLLLGSVVSSTDAAAVFSVLRSKSVSLKGDLAPVLEFESGSNDPMAAMMTIFMVGVLQTPGGGAWWQFPLNLIGKLGFGGVIGVLIGMSSCRLFNRSKLDYEGLYFVLGIATVLVSYGVTELLQCNGFMAVYCAGLTMSAHRYNYKKSQLRINNGIAWLMQMMMFIVLGMLVTPGDLIQPPPGGRFWVAGYGVILALILMLLARPFAVFCALAGSKFSVREKILISWVGLRGAAPIVLATFPLVAFALTDQAQALMLFNLVFCMVLASVFIQGRTLMPLARLLKLDAPLLEKPRSPLELEETGVISSVMHEFEVHESSPCINRTLAELKLPSGVLVMLIRRGGSFLLARGNTVIEAGDGVMVMGEAAQMCELGEKLFPGNDFYDD